MYQSRVVSNNYELRACQVSVELGHGKHQSQNLAICRSQLRFSCSTVAGRTTDDVAFVVRLPLLKDSSKGVMGEVSVNNKRPVRFGHRQNRFGHKVLSELVKGGLAEGRPYPLHILL